MSEQTLRVSTIRSQNPQGKGGCIFTGAPIDGQGNVLDARAYYVVRASNRVLGGTSVQVGQWWRVGGDPTHNAIIVNGYHLTEWQITASEAELLLPSGEHIITLMAESAEFQGIGLVKARKLWETFGSDLYDILDRGDVVSLAKILTEDSARQVVSAWTLYGNTRALQWLHAKGLDQTTGRKVLAFFGAETPEKIEADPYRLLSFCATWRQVDSLARHHFGIEEHDARRVQGAIEESCYRLFGDGHTVATRSMLVERLATVLGEQNSTSTWRDRMSDALSRGLTNGSYVIEADGCLRPLGPFVMETEVARAIADRLHQTNASQLLSDGEVHTLLSAYEVSEGISLNDEQRSGILTAAANAFALITGGAGVGKTTVLKALYEIYDRAGVHIYQMALAGRAAKRMQEATARPASTIASFLRTTQADSFATPSVVVVDEASMVDIISMSRLCGLLPNHVRMLLVGDPNQLMPVGPGLVLHALTEMPRIPNAKLKVVKRYGGAIAAAAHAIHGGAWPDLPDIESAPIAFIPWTASSGRHASEPDGTLADEVLRLYLQSPTNTQILSSRRNGIDGTNGLNALCQLRLTANSRPLRLWSSEYAMYVHTGFHLGDPLLCTRNLWEWGLQNGSLGKLAQIEDEPRLIRDDDGTEKGYALAWVEWDDGERRPIFEGMLDDLELGYAITVHKAQGSQWERILIPITGNRLLDRTLIYTAVTRAQWQVILVGDEAAARRAVEAVPRARHRRVALGATVADQLAIAEGTT
ncbi:ATP-dependent DNA helicase [Paraburkholderia elongata]|uniref:AAA family ATPase n=1 Tax=Paraburkholderia elongata TaxID=2675747 RepID=A0A972NPM5_9BURK|nr:AAA family ATPase [Paraburkholderia elongata]NPT57393.1 AAA family ATPase [Paraburkholderia elongata]